MRTQTNWRDTPVPSLTETYSPVAHSELIFLLEKQLDTEGYKVIDNTVSQNYDGQQIAGTMKLFKETGISGDGLSQTVAYTNSYNKRIPIRLVSGGNVWICSNGMIVGDNITMRKHTGEVFPALKELVAIAIERMERDFEKTQGDIIKMKSVDLTTTLAAELVGRMYIEERILNSNEVNEVARQLRNPYFEDFKVNNMWSLYNHATYAMKGAAPDRQMSALKNLHEFAMDVTNEMLVHV